MLQKGQKNKGVGGFIFDSVIRLDDEAKNQFQRATIPSVRIGMA